jgi:hypothetical protein
MMSDELSSILDEAEVFERLPYATEGRYTVRIDSTDYREFNNGTVIEMTVLESDGPKAIAEGERCKWYLNLTVTKRTAPYVGKRLKGFALPALGKKDASGKEIEDALKSSSPGPFAGKTVRLVVQPSMNKKTGELKINEKTGEPYMDAEWFAA